MPSSNNIEEAPGQGPVFTELSPGDLLFDPKNPRFGDEIQPATPAEVQRKLIRPPNVALQLVGSLIENGFIKYEPLVVRKDGEKYRVIEGNRRLAAVKHILSHPKLYPSDAVERLKKIPVLVFHKKKDISHKEDIRNYLGVHHLFGFKDWPPRSKAAFLDAEIRTKEDIKKLVEQLGIEKTKIAQYLIPYRLMKKARRLFPKGKIPGFWMLGEALRRRGIREYIELEWDPNSLKLVSYHKQKIKYLIEFIYGAKPPSKLRRYGHKGYRRILETRDLTDLAKVLSSERACKEIEKGASLEEAQFYVQSRDKTFTSLLRRLEKILEKMIELKPTPAEQRIVNRKIRAFRQKFNSL